MSVLFLSRRDVEELLPPAEALAAVEAAFAGLAQGETLQPLRQALWLPDRRGLLGTMPGGLLGEGLLGIKVVSVFPGAHAAGEETHRGIVMLFEGELGRPLALLDAAAVTAVRTAAASALATRLLAREDACDLALLGSGVQARTHLDALAQVRPLRRVRVWSRTAGHARAFAEREAARTGLPVEAVGSAREAVSGADLVATVTAASEPVLEGRWLSPGAHVNAVGACTPRAREVDAETVARSRLFVDRLESALNESGDFLLAKAEGAVRDEHIVGELGDLLLGRLEGRTGRDDVTLFESLGLAVQDLAAADRIYRRAREEGRGLPLDL